MNTTPNHKTVELKPFYYRAEGLYTTIDTIASMVYAANDRGYDLGVSHLPMRNALIKTGIDLDGFYDTMSAETVGSPSTISTILQFCGGFMDDFKKLGNEWGYLSLTTFENETEELDSMNKILSIREKLIKDVEQLVKFEKIVIDFIEGNNKDLLMGV